MNSNVQAMYRNLRDRFLGILYGYQTYQEVYSQAGKVDFMNNVVRNFCVRFQNDQARLFFIDIRAMFDRDDRTCSINQLQDLVSSHWNLGVDEQKKFDRLCQSAIDFAEPFKERANNLYAHWNFKVARGETKLPEVYFRDWKNVIEKINDVLNFVQNLIDGSSTCSTMEVGIHNLRSLVVYAKMGYELQP